MDENALEPDESPFVTDVLLTGRHCVDCISAKTGVRQRNVGRHIGYIASLVFVVTSRALCDGCLQETIVYWLG
jgi:hypothetical protein